MHEHHRPSLRHVITTAALLLGLGLPAAGCDSGTTGSSNPIEGDWEVSLYQGTILPDRQDISDPYSGTSYRETRGEMSLFGDMTGYVDIITEQAYEGSEEPFFDYRVWDARVFPEDGDALTLRVNYRDNLIFLDCNIGSGGSLLSCTDSSQDPPEDPTEPDFTAWEFIRKS